MPGRQEQRFIETVDSVEFLDRDLGVMIVRLESWLDRLSGDIRAARPDNAGLDDDHALVVQARKVDEHLQRSVADWARQWETLKPAQALADAFDDKVILLVFGKFNAGKSAFCNFLAERFAHRGKSVRYFQLDAGRLVESDAAFQEGSTETTSRLQGVVLGNKLLLLDTPGLHSVTDENAALTQRYIDSADGVLWLTSSTSPGQVQELDELARELRRNKPLLPVVTRSDFYEEDEVDGELCRLLRNKSPENRELQEQDVHARAQAKLKQLEVAPVALRPPVSISCHAARKRGQTPEALSDAGFERLYDALLGIVVPALRYKQRQPAEMLLHHFEENVLSTLFDDILPRLAALIHALEAEHGLMMERKAQFTRGLWRDVAPSLPELLRTHAQQGGAQAACDALTQQLRIAVEPFLPQVLAGYTPALAPEDMRVELGAGALPAAEMHGPIPGERLERVYEALESALLQRLDSLAGQVFEQYAARIDTLALGAQDLRDMLQAHAQRLNNVKRDLRA